MALLTLDEIVFPDPTAYVFEKEPIANFERTANGNLVGDMIAMKNKLTVSWDLLEDRYVQDILNIIWKGFVIAYFYDPAEGMNGYEVFVSLQSASLAYNTNKVKWWKNVSLKLTER